MGGGGGRRLPPDRPPAGGRGADGGGGARGGPFVFGGGDGGGARGGPAEEGGGTRGGPTPGGEGVCGGPSVGGGGIGGVKAQVEAFNLALGKYGESGVTTRGGKKTQSVARACTPTVGSSASTNLGLEHLGGGSKVGERSGSCDISARKAEEGTLDLAIDRVTGPADDMVMEANANSLKGAERGPFVFANGGTEKQADDVEMDGSGQASGIERKAGEGGALLALEASPGAKNRNADGDPMAELEVGVASSGKPAFMPGSVSHLFALTGHGGGAPPAGECIAKDKGSMEDVIMEVREELHGDATVLHGEIPHIQGPV